MKTLLMRFLFYLLDPVPQKEMSEKSIKAWLIFSWQHPGFQAYIAKRDWTFLRELAGGSGMTEVPRDNYVRMVGQRFELLNFARICRQAFNESQAEARKASLKEE